jgi:hypothetical protein
MPVVPQSEVKGAWFVTARRYVIQDHGDEVFARYWQAAPEASRDALREPVVSRWYPETVMRDALESFYREVSNRDAEKFSAAMERCAVLGVHWFVQVLVSVSTPRFINHPFSDHPCYRLATPAILRAILGLCVGQSARAVLLEYDATSQVCEVRW